MILVDSNVLLDVFNDDPQWGQWSMDTIVRVNRNNALAINPVIYAEISVQFDDVAPLDQALSLERIQRLSLPYEAAFIAAKSFKEYRQRGGVRRSPLPDFFIGAHAVVADMKLLTRDRNRYQTYFPTLQLITP